MNTNEQANGDKLPCLCDQQNGNDAIARAIAENTRVLLDLKAVVERLAESAAATPPRKTTASATTGNGTVAEALEVYKACPDTGLFARADVINGLKAANILAPEKRRISEFIVALAAVELLARIGEKAGSRYMKVPGIDEERALKRISSAEFAAAMAHG